MRVFVSAIQNQNKFAYSYISEHSYLCGAPRPYRGRTEAVQGSYRDRTEAVQRSVQYRARKGQDVPGISGYKE